MNNRSLERSASFIGAITSHGYWCMTMLYSTNNSEKFVEILRKLFVWLRVGLKIDVKKIVLILDNWAIHLSKKTMNYLNEIGWKIIFVSLYSHEYCPIELYLIF